MEEPQDRTKSCPVQSANTQSLAGGEHSGGSIQYYSPESESESESVRSPESESESESGWSYHDSAPLICRAHHL